MPIELQTAWEATSETHTHGMEPITFLRPEEEMPEGVKWKNKEIMIIKLWVVRW
jgi:hypothetical protein